jgi:hypothetical protein
MDKKTSLLQFTMTYGAILGAVSIIISVIVYITGFIPFNLKRMLLMGLLSLAISIIFVSTGIKSYRDKILGGSITFSQALIVGLLIIVFSTILASFYSLIFNLFIDPDYNNRIIEAMKNWQYDFMTNMGATEDQIEDAISKIEKQQAEYTPLKGFFQSIYVSAIFGTILSLLIAAFTKKNKNPFA